MFKNILLRRTLMIGSLALMLAACSGPTTEISTAAPEPIGDFKLGIVTVFAKNVQKGPLSRTASIPELEAALKSEALRVFTPYTGTKFFNIAIAVDAYVLATPGIPLIASPKSGMVVSLNVWDNAKKTVVTEEHKQFTSLEKITGGSFFLGSGLTLSKEEQLAELAVSAIKQIEAYMRENQHLFVSDVVIEIVE